MDLPDPAYDDPLLAGHQHTAASVRVVGGDRVLDVPESEAVFVELRRIDDQLELHGLAPEQRHVGDARHLLELREDYPVLQILELPRPLCGDSSVYR